MKKKKISVDGNFVIIGLLAVGTVISSVVVVRNIFFPDRSAENALMDNAPVPPDPRKGEHTELKRFVVADDPPDASGTASQIEVDCKTGLWTRHSEKGLHLFQNDDAAYARCFKNGLASFRTPDDARERVSDGMVIWKAPAFDQGENNQFVLDCRTALITRRNQHVAATLTNIPIARKICSEHGLKVGP